MRLCNNPLLGVYSPEKARLLVEAALDRLPPRARSIIARCDLAGEPNKNVAGDLGISERHFYRERRAAVTSLCDAIDKVNRKTASSGGVDVNPNDAVLACANALRNAGRTQEAIALLEKTLSGTAWPLRKVRLSIRLAELFCENDQLTRVAEFLKSIDESGNDQLRSLPIQHAVGLELATLHSLFLLRTAEADNTRAYLTKAIREFKPPPIPETGCGMLARWLMQSWPWPRFWKPAAVFQKR
jgi:hypothetical protein